SGRSWPTPRGRTTAGCTAARCCTATSRPASPTCWRRSGSSPARPSSNARRPARPSVDGDARHQVGLLLLEVLEADLLRLEGVVELLDPAQQLGRRQL